jgi:parallel beta-helix repeat protein
MKKNFIKSPIAAAIIAAVSIFCLPSSVFAQGALTPPGAPAPTMKTLAQIEPRTAITNIANGYIISAPGSYYLTTNLTGVNSGNGVIIASGNVTLDLNGFVLQGVPGSLAGIAVSTTYTNITVYNGTITGWGGSGIDAFSGGYPRNLVFERLTLSNNGGSGILTEAGSVVRDCYSMSNHLDGIICCGGLVSGCMVRDNGRYGITAQKSTVSGCYVEDSTWSGIFVSGSGCQIIGNNCFTNNTSGSTSDAGIYVQSSNNRIEDNHVTISKYAGICVASSSFTNNIIVKNTVIGSANNYIIPANQAAGPLITTTGTITNSNPWANFSF